ncbi:transcription intermediary factor 1-alpha-like [Mercenaria mercenaria]|uniref:transcription intermediary factor 1-alpha-like n=1 Tax=Mercenaria mercenaria TaxID=6596 RepID=UPI00234EC2B5|nr:transcription intermediary factor 1-alpha-like [Mercenaria mercenaria]
MEVAGRKLEAEDETPRDEHVFCEPCEVESTKTEANGACRECKEYMCTTCFRHHLKGKLCRNHVLLPIGELSSMSLDSSKETVEKCEKHDNEPVKFYCRTHDIVRCGDCIVLGHATCKPEYIKDLAKTFKNGDEFKNLVKKLDMLELYMAENAEIIIKNKGDIELMNKKALKEIRQFRSDINIYLDKAEANILSQVKPIGTENKMLQRKLEQDVKALTQGLEEVKQKLNMQLHHGNALFINAIRCKSKLDDIEKMHAKIKQQLSVKRFEFIRDENISGILQAAQQLGKLRIYSGPDGNVKHSDFVVGLHVRRGPDWKWENQDSGGLGTVTGFNSKGWAAVTWDKGGNDVYRIGQEDAFDLEIV